MAAPEGRLNPTDQDVQLDEVLLSTVTLAVNPPAHWLPMVIVTPHVPVVTGAAVVVTGATVVVTGAAVVVTGAAVVVVGAAVVVVGAAVVVVGAAVVVVGAAVVVVGAAVVVVGAAVVVVTPQGWPFRVNEVGMMLAPDQVPSRPNVSDEPAGMGCPTRMGASPAMVTV